MTRVLLILVCAFAALSSSTAEALGLGEGRIALFAGLVLALLLLPFLRGQRLGRPPSAGLVVLFLLLLAIALLDARGRLDPLDYKLAIPPLVVLAAPALRRSLGGLDLDRLVWRLLSAYVAVTFAYQLWGQPEAVTRAYGGVTRYDPTGSVVMHASLSTIHLVLAVTRAARPGPWRPRSAAGALGLVSLSLVLSAATRTVLITLALAGAAAVLTAPRRGPALRAMLGTVVLFVGAFAAYQALFDASFAGRLAGEGTADWSSGRGPSIGYWFDQLGDRPLGLGLGAVRERLADGKPFLDGEETVEWPHDEFIRLFIEAGPLGLAFVAILAGLLLRRALRAAARAGSAERRMLLCVIAADLLAELALQNLLNAVYHATILILVLCLAAEPDDPAAAAAMVPGGPAPLAVPSARPGG